MYAAITIHEWNYVLADGFSFSDIWYDIAYTTD